MPALLSSWQGSEITTHDEEQPQKENVIKPNCIVLGTAGFINQTLMRIWVLTEKEKGAQRWAPSLSAHSAMNQEERKEGSGEFEREDCQGVELAGYLDVSCKTLGVLSTKIIYTLWV